MTAAGERTKCHCGTGMLLTASGKGQVCPNCDVLQMQESFSLARRKTAEDIRFNMYWLRVFDEEYPEMPEGWEENRPGSDIVPPPTSEEGETHE